MANRNSAKRYLSFITAVANGQDQYKAYLDHVATRKDIKEETARTNATKLLSQPNIRKQLEEMKAKIQTAMIENTARAVSKEFAATALTVAELDAFHCSIVRGEVEVEEVIPVYNWQDILNAEGKVVKRVRQAAFMRVKRPPNIRERQVSVDALYRRKGSYAKGFPGQDPNDGDENVQRVVILSDGSKLELP